MCAPGHAGPCTDHPVAMPPEVCSPTMVDPTMRRKVLVLAYYFPPLALSGVQRIVGFVKYLPRFGWQPTVITANPSGYYAFDQGLRDDVEAAGVAICSTRSFDPTRLFGRRRVVALPSEPVRRRIAAVNHALFVPDNKIGWVPFAVSAGKRLHRAQPFDAILISAPPYSALLAARRLARRLDLPLVIDFRDDWVENPFHRYPTAWHKRCHTFLERRVVAEASTVTAINRVIRDSLARRNPKARAIVALPHGHDVDGAPSAERRNKMRFMYTGIFYGWQTPDYFLRALAEVVRCHPEIAAHVDAHFLGQLPKQSQMLITSLGLERIVTFHGYVPHADVLAAQQSADVLWMTIGTQPGGHGLSTSKLSEYMGCRKPILALVPPGIVREDLERYQAAVTVHPEDVGGIAKALIGLFRAWKHGSLPVPDEHFVMSRSQTSITKKLAGYLEASLRSSPAS